MFLPLLAITALQTLTGMSANNKAAGIQSAAAEENNARYAEIQKLLAPWVTGGQTAFGQQGDLIGMNGADAQAAAIKAIEQGPQFGAMVQQGENAMLQSASATGGLRGGNTQAALAQFRPQVLSQLIGQQFANLGGISANGMNAAVNQGAVAQNMAQQTTAGANAMGQAAVANGNLVGGFANGIGGYLGQFGMPPVMGASPDQAAQDAYYNYWGKSF